MATYIVGTQLSATIGPAEAIGASTLNERAQAHTTYISPVSGWVTRLGARIKNTGTGNIWCYLVLRSLNDTGAPGAIIARTGRLAVGNLYADIGGLVAVQGKVTAGQRLALGIKVEGGPTAVATLVETTMTWTRTTGGNALPTDPMVPSASAVDNILGIYAEINDNVAPMATLTSPVAGAEVSAAAPTIAGTFSDADSTLRGDKMRSYQIEVRQQGQTPLLWGGPTATFIATSAEHTAATFSRAYAGTTLVGGPIYEVRAAVEDDLGAWSLWTDWRTFQLSSRGAVSLATATTPTAKIDTASELIGWQALWSHPGALAMNAAQVRILSNGATQKTGLLVTISAINGALFTVTAAAAGIGVLESGTYAYEVQGRSTDGILSPWSAPKNFVINSPPTTPSGLEPPNGAAATTRPFLQWLISDPNADDVFGIDCYSQVRIQRPDATTILIDTFNYDTILGRGYYQVLALDAPNFGTYTWDVRGRDVSASEALGWGAWSTPKNFVFNTGPIVTITNPTEGETETTSTPVFTWTPLTGQTRAFIKIYKANAGQAFKQQDLPNFTGSTFTPPAGWLQNKGVYDLEIKLWDSLNQDGTSLRRRFAINYGVQVALVGVELSGMLRLRDQEFSSVLTAWEETTLNPGEFAGYVIRRRLASAEPGTETVIKTIKQRGQTQWIDPYPTPNTLLWYGISQLRDAGGGTLESPVVEAFYELTTIVPTLTSAIDPSLHAALMWLNRSYQGEFDRPETTHVTWGSKGKPVVLAAPAEWGARRVTATITLRSDHRGTLDEHIKDWEEIRNSGHPFFFQAERAEECMWCRVATANWSRGSNAGTRSISLKLEEVDFKEGK